ncbi:MAG: LysR family transcriptional regulator [Myxococcota bacterium]
MSQSELDVSVDGLRIFVAVAEQGSMVAAATQLGISRTTIRRQMDQLEDAIGFRLVFRNRDGVELTNDGHRFLVEAKNLLGLMRQTILKAREHRSQPATTLRVAVQVGYPMPFTMMLDTTTSQRFPGTVVEYLIAERPADLLPDKADIAMCLGDQLPKVPCVSVDLLTIRQRLFAAPSYIDAHGPFDAPKNTVQHIVGTWRAPDGDHSALHLREGGRLSFTPRTITSDEGYLRAIASLGQGLIYAPLPLNDGLHQAEPLVPILDEEVGRRVPITLHTLEAAANVPRVKFAVEMIRDVLARWDESDSV